MRPDMRRHVRSGWGTLAGCGLFALILLSVAGPGDETADQLEQARDEVAKKSGPRDFDRLLGEQREANAELAGTIEDLKQDSGMSRNPYFIIPEDAHQKGQLLLNRFYFVRAQITKLAKPRSVTITNFEDLGLGAFSGGRVPPDDELEDLAPKLQLVHKAMTIALDLNRKGSFSEVTIDAKAPPVVSGPKDRPLLIEYPLTLTVRGSLQDILSVLHRFSQVAPETIEARAASDEQTDLEEEERILALYPSLKRQGEVESILSAEQRQLIDQYNIKRDYPLIITDLVIDGENFSEKDRLAQLTATFTVAGMRFLSAEERSAITADPRQRASGSARATTRAAPAASPGSSRKPPPRTPTGRATPRRARP